LNKLAAAAALAGTLAAAAAHANPVTERYGEEYQKCKQGSTADIVRCVDALVGDWQTRLDDALKKLIDQMDDPRRRDELRAAQDLWLKFREANCGWYAAGPGTLARIEGVECMRSMTAERALELEEAGGQN
jgi:uncharacterized protein YecT (DUF1311 family)